MGEEKSQTFVNKQSQRKGLVQGMGCLSNVRNKLIKKINPWVTLTEGECGELAHWCSRIWRWLDGEKILGSLIHLGAGSPLPFSLSVPPGQPWEGQRLALWGGDFIQTVLRGRSTCAIPGAMGSRHPPLESQREGLFPFCILSLGFLWEEACLFPPRPHSSHLPDERDNTLDDVIVCVSS